MRKVTDANYKKDKHYPAVVRAVTTLLERQGYVAPVDVLLETGRITKDQFEDWRFGRVPYLDRVCAGNLSKLSRVLRILEKHCLSMGLKPSQTAYRRWGKGKKHLALRFTKFGDANLEAAYSRHYVSAAKIREKQAAKQSKPMREENKRSNDPKQPECET